MAVVINEFEVIAASPPPPEATPKGAEKTEPWPAPPMVHDLGRVMRFYAERRARPRPLNGTDGNRDGECRRWPRTTATAAWCRRLAR